jgi:7,8-dihydropterin-6-yl-methyl-4-(beta-D-ribofuranosyl)aminobenzene 5'-phosphate synthase
MLSYAKYDVERSDVVVLSHHHWDHTGGLRFWEPTKRKQLVAHPQAIEKIPADESKALRAKFEVRTDTKPYEFFLGQILRATDFEDGKYLDDPMLDDSAIAIKTEAGAIVVTGCSHAGVCNIAQRAKEVTGQPLRGVIGGFHLLSAPDSVLEKTVQYFKDERVEFLHPMHCVDHVAMSAFYQSFGVKKFGAGDSFEIENK